MKLYDGVIASVEVLLKEKKGISFPAEKITPLSQTDANQLIFKNEQAYELGGGNLPGLAATLLTDNPSFVKQNEIILIGKDLPDIRGDSPYARIVIALVDDEMMGKGNLLYANVRKVDYIRYHVFPEGYMLKISPMNRKESVRVAKTLVKKKNSFSGVGRLFIDQYLTIPFVKAVKIIFITDPAVDYTALTDEMNNAENITQALDHLLNKVNMDCHSCKLQTVCNEVEQLTKDDFKKENE